MSFKRMSSHLVHMRTKTIRHLLNWLVYVKNWLKLGSKDTKIYEVLRVVLYANCTQKCRTMPIFKYLELRSCIHKLKIAIIPLIDLLADWRWLRIFLSETPLTVCDQIPHISYFSCHNQKVKCMLWVIVSLQGMILLILFSDVLGKCRCTKLFSFAFASIDQIFLIIICPKISSIQFCLISRYS